MAVRTLRCHANLGPGVPCNRAADVGVAFGPLAGGWLFDTFGDYAWLSVGSSGAGLGAAAPALAFPPLPSLPAHRLQPA